MDMKLKLLSTEILCLGISLRQAFCLFLSFFLFCSFLPSITEFLVKKCCSPVPNAQSPDFFQLLRPNQEASCS